MSGEEKVRGRFKKITKIEKISWNKKIFVRSEPINQGNIFNNRKKNH